MQSLLLALSVLCVGPAFAGCSVSSTGVAFGAYRSPIQKSDVLSSGAIQLVCDSTSLGVPYKLKIGSMQSEGSSKYLSNGKEKLYYNLYLDAGRSMVWGDGLFGTSFHEGNTQAKETLSVFGKVDGSQNVEAGTYTDLITVLMEF